MGKRMKVCVTGLVSGKDTDLEPWFQGVVRVSAWEGQRKEAGKESQPAHFRWVGKEANHTPLVARQAVWSKSTNKMG